MRNDRSFARPNRRQRPGKREVADAAHTGALEPREMRVRGIGTRKPAVSWTTLLYAAGAAVGGVLLALMLGFGLPTAIHGTGITDHDGNRRGPDFLTHYTAGHMVLTGDARHLYDPSVQAAAQEAALGAPLDRPSPFLLPP